MIKLIASDIDGTLVHDGTHELNPELCDVILQLKEKGIQFAAASGRQWASIEDLFDPIKERIFYLSDNAPGFNFERRMPWTESISKYH